MDLHCSEHLGYLKTFRPFFLHVTLKIQGQKCPKGLIIKAKGIIPRGASGWLFFLDCCPKEKKRIEKKGRKAACVNDAQLQLSSALG